MRLARAARLAPLVGFALGVVALSAACQKKPRVEEASPPAPAAVDSAVESTQVVNPVPEAGRMGYLAACAMCHGPRCAGDGPLASELRRQGARPPAALDDRARLDPLGRQGILDVIAKGSAHTSRASLMPPWGRTLGPGLLDQVADHVLALPEFGDSASAADSAFLASPAGLPEHAREHYVFYCAACHGPFGHGDGPCADALWSRNQVRPRDLTDHAYFSSRTDPEIFAALSLGGGHTGKSIYMPAWNYTFPREQIRELVSYVRSISHTAPVPGRP